MERIELNQLLMALIIKEPGHKLPYELSIKTNMRSGCLFEFTIFNEHYDNNETMYIWDTDSDEMIIRKINTISFCIEDINSAKFYLGEA